MVKRSLSEQDMVEILEDIAGTSNNAAARIAAIKVLREMDAGEKPSSAGFAALDELVEPRRLRTKLPQDPPVGFAISEKSG